MKAIARPLTAGRKKAAESIRERRKPKSMKERYSDMPYFIRAVITDLAHLVWWVIYLSVAFLLVSFIVINVPEIAAYLYGYLSGTVGINVESATIVDLIFWACVCLTGGALLVHYVTKGADYLLKSWYNITIAKHCRIKAAKHQKELPQGTAEEASKTAAGKE